MRCRGPLRPTAYSAALTCRAVSKANSTASVRQAVADPLERVAHGPRDALQNPHRPGGQHLAEHARLQRALIDVEWCLAAVVRVGEDVVDDQCATDIDPAGPSVEVAVRGLLGVATVDEQEPQRR